MWPRGWSLCCVNARQSFLPAVLDIWSALHLVELDACLLHLCSGSRHGPRLTHLLQFAAEIVEERGANPGAARLEVVRCSTLHCRVLSPYRLLHFLQQLRRILEKGADKRRERLGVLRHHASQLLQGLRIKTRLEQNQAIAGGF